MVAPFLAGAPDVVHCIVEKAWESTGAALMVVDAEATIWLANSVGARALAAAGLSVGDNALAGHGLPLFAPGDGENPGHEGPLQRAVAGQVVREEDFVARNGDGPLLRFRVSMFPFSVGAGSSLVLVVWRDITSRWQAQERLRLDLDRLNRLMAGAVDYAIILLDPDGKVLTWGAAAELLLNWPESDVVGRSWSTFFTPQDQVLGLPDRTLAAATVRGRVETEGMRMRGDGSCFWARTVLTAQRLDDGELSGFVQVSHDITAEHRARRRAVELNVHLRELNDDLERRVRERTIELEIANEELEAFSYSVSHDLRAPLRAISGFARMIAEDGAGSLDGPARHRLDRIQANTRRMGELIEGLLALSRLHREGLTDETFDMTDLARKAWEGLVPAGWPGVLHLEELPPAWADRRLVSEVWTNLLENALKFTGRTARPRIAVTSEQIRGRTAYRVTDNGAGFDDRGKGELFTPFQRLHRPEDFPGTGIGLALVGRIVRRHGGTIDVEATEGQGASFWFTLAPPVAGTGS